MTLPPARPRAPDAFASFDLDSLTSGAARMRPERLALSCASGLSLTFAELDERASSLAAHLSAAGLAPGDCLLISCGAGAAPFIAMIGAVRAGLDVALAPLHLDAGALAAFARSAKACALAGETHYTGVNVAECMLGAAALAPDVRILFNLSQQVCDEAAMLAPMQLAAQPAPRRVRAPGDCSMLTLEGGVMRSHSQQSLVSAGLELLSRARIGMKDPIFTTLAPVRFGALAAGPFAALLAGCALHCHAPFDAQRFLVELDAMAPAHLVAPWALAKLVSGEGFAAGAALASLMATGAPASANTNASGATPIIDIDALAGFAGGARMSDTGR